MAALVVQAVVCPSAVKVLVKSVVMSATVPKPCVKSEFTEALTEAISSSPTVLEPGPAVSSSRKLRIKSAGAPSLSWRPSEASEAARMPSSKPSAERSNSRTIHVNSI